MAASGAAPLPSADGPLPPGTTMAASDAAPPPSADGLQLRGLRLPFFVQLGGKHDLVAGLELTLLGVVEVDVVLVALVPQGLARDEAVAVPAVEALDDA